MMEKKFRLIAFFLLAGLTWIFFQVSSLEHRVFIGGLQLLIHWELYPAFKFFVVAWRPALVTILMLGIVTAYSFLYWRGRSQQGWDEDKKQKKSNSDTPPSKWELLKLNWGLEKKKKAKKRAKKLFIILAALLFAALFDAVTLKQWQFGQQALPLSLQLFLALVLTFLLYYAIWLFRLLQKPLSINPKGETKKGHDLISEEELASLLKHRKPSLPITDLVSIPDDIITENVIGFGKTGAGKTTLITRQVEKVLQGGQAIVTFKKYKEIEYFVEKYPHQCVVIDPFRWRKDTGKPNPHWNFIKDMLRPDAPVTVVDTLANTLVPKPTGSSKEDGHIKFFQTGVRSIITAAAKAEYTESRSETSVESFLKRIRSPETRNQLKKLLEDYAPEAIDLVVQETVTTQGVVSHLDHALNMLAYTVKIPGQENWSLHDWLENGRPGVVFLPMIHSQMPVLKPYFSLFLNAAGALVLDWPDSLQKKFYFFFDEPEMLDRLDILVWLANIGRSGGVSVSAYTRNKGLVDSIYTPEIAEAIFGNCSTLIVFTVKGSKNLEAISEAIGSRKIRQIERVLGGKEPDRFSEKEISEYPILSKSEISDLDKLNAIVKIGNLAPASLEIPLNKEIQKDRNLFELNPYWQLDNAANRWAAEIHQRNNGLNNGTSNNGYADDRPELYGPDNRPINWAGIN